MNNISPNPLQKGDTIGVVAPSSPSVSGTEALGIHYLRQKGFKLKFGNHIHDRDRFLAGRDVDRAQDVMDFFKDGEVKAIIALRGGQGSQRLLPLLDYDLIAANPKIVVGFSDTTALQLGLLKKAGLTSYTGFTLTTPIDSLIEKTLMSCLMNTPYRITGGKTVNQGVINGEVVGGNLSLLTSLIGTPYQPDFQGKILLFEEVGVEPYNVDRMISHLHLAGVFEQVSGIIIGEFENCIAKESDSADGTINEIINDWSSRFHVPCIKEFPYGHGNNRSVLPLGGCIFLMQLLVRSLFLRKKRYSVH